MCIVQGRPGKTGVINLQPYIISLQPLSQQKQYFQLLVPMPYVEITVSDGRTLDMFPVKIPHRVRESFTIKYLSIITIR